MIESFPQTSPLRRRALSPAGVHRGRQRGRRLEPAFGQAAGLEEAVEWHAGGHEEADAAAGEPSGREAQY
jgi:hypothetical protein